MNCGDWVESCSALVEHEDGRFEILTWFEGAEWRHPGPPLIGHDDDDDEEEEAEIAA